MAVKARSSAGITAFPRYCPGPAAMPPWFEGAAAGMRYPLISNSYSKRPRPMKKSLIALSLLAALPFAASAADGISYNYVEGGYAATNADVSDADGFAIRGSGAIAPNFHVFGDYSKQKTDDF